ncbi:MAG: nuclease-related domain-containing protein [Gammaproteobacteria bacterium]|nr:nuclease-related domain-containing protein [Gammaproteobacteria bacterium]
MDYSPILEQVYTLYWLIPLFVVAGFLTSAWFKGWLGEALVKLAAKLWLDSEVYHPIHNVTLPTDDGSTQIDHIFVSRYGVFVVETKNMKGWIFGSERQANWTQKIYKKSYKFQNPLRQNYKHIKTLEAALDIPAEAIHSVITFVGDSTFKTQMPSNVTHGSGCIRYIKSFKAPALTGEQMERSIAAIESGRLTESSKTDRKHVKNLRQRHAKND